MLVNNFQYLQGIVGNNPNYVDNVCLRYTPLTNNGQLEKLEIK